MNTKPEVPLLTLPGSAPEEPPTDLGPMKPEIPKVEDRSPSPAIPEDTTPQKPAMVRLIESSGPKLSEILSKCDFHNPPLILSWTTCGYYKVMVYFYRGMCLKSKAQQYVIRGEKLNTDKVPGGLAKTSKPAVPSKPVSNSIAKPVKKDKKKTPPKEDKSIGKASEAVDNVSKPNVTEPKVVEAIEPSFTQTTEKDAVPTPIPDIPLSTVSTDNQIKLTSDITPTSTEQTMSCTTTDSKVSCTMGPNLDSIRPTHTLQPLEQKATQIPSTEEKPAVAKENTDTKDTAPKAATKPAETAKNEATPQPPTEAIPPTQPNAQEDKANVAEKKADSAEKIIYGEVVEKDPEEVELVNLPTDDFDFVKLPSGKKQNTFMMLKNRIKELELNLNLSSR